MRRSCFVLPTYFYLPSLLFSKNTHAREKLFVNSEQASPIASRNHATLHRPRLPTSPTLIGCACSRPAPPLSLTPPPTHQPTSLVFKCCWRERCRPLKVNVRSAFVLFHFRSLSPSLSLSRTSPPITRSFVTFFLKGET